MMQGQFGRAAVAYEEWLELMAHRKMQGSDLWNEVSAKLREAEFAEQGQRRWLVSGAETVRTEAPFERQSGEDVAFSAWCGDWDRHALNHRVTADGHVLHMDRNNGQLIEEPSTPLTPGVPATDVQVAEMKRIMLTRMRMMWTAAAGGQQLYQPTAWMERHLSMDDFAPTLRRIEEVSPDAMRQRLNAMPELTDVQKEQIIAQLELRRRLLPEVLDEFVQSTRTRSNGLAPNEWIDPAQRLRLGPMPIQAPPERVGAAIELRPAA